MPPKLETPPQTWTKQDWQAACAHLWTCDERGCGLWPIDCKLCKAIAEHLNRES